MPSTLPHSARRRSAFQTFCQFSCTSPQSRSTSTVFTFWWISVSWTQSRFPSFSIEPHQHLLIQPLVSTLRSRIPSKCKFLSHTQTHLPTAQHHFTLNASPLPLLQLSHRHVCEHMVPHSAPLPVSGKTRPAKDTCRSGPESLTCWHCYFVLFYVKLQYIRGNLKRSFGLLLDFNLL